MNKLDFYHSYYSNLTPNNFNVIKGENEVKIINIPTTYIKSKGGTIKNIPFHKLKSEIDEKAEFLCNDLECDGTTSIISYYLDTLKIPHQIKVGEIKKVTSKGSVIKNFAPHFWIELFNDDNMTYIIDYKAQLWLGEDAPNGVFSKAETEDKNWIYKGEKVEVSPLNKRVLYDFKSSNYKKGGLTPTKAKKILEDGEVHDKPLTDKQLEFFNVISAQKMTKGGKVKKGDCFELAGKIAMGSNYGNKIPEISYKGTPYVIHAQVEGQGNIQGLKYGHAWVEDDIFIYDFSNGKELQIPKEIYYAIGNIKTLKPYYYKYTFKEALNKMVDTGHYGSWDLKTESGL